jgi:uncharacterized phage protein (TIGR02218 family)
MAQSNIRQYENSIQDGQPIECYKFTHDGIRYFYTSHCNDVEIPITNNGVQHSEKYFAEYIKRDTIKPSSKGDSSSVTVTVAQDHPVARLFYGPPPERAVNLKLYRLHDQDKEKFDAIITGRVSQAAFEDSECKLTVKMDSGLSKEIPNMKRQFLCGNMFCDSKCKMTVESVAITAFVDRVINNLEIDSTSFAEYPDGYLAGGFMRYNGSARLIREHKGNKVVLQYPFITMPHNEVIVIPGCDHTFKTCAVRYQNTEHFTGFLYVPPIDPTKKKVGHGIYWVDSQVVQRDTDGFIGTISM